MTARVLAAFAVVLCAACSRGPDLASEIARIRAIDHHAHPVLAYSEGPPDREFDALPVDNMEPASDPLYLRPGAPGIAEAKRALFPSAPKQQVMKDKGDGYPAWVLDQMGTEIMFANRVRMGRGIAPPRFLWVPYADALLFPLDNTALAAKNSDRKAFFGYEDAHRKRYLKEAGYDAPPPILDEYLARVVTPTLERQKQGGAVAEKFEAAYLRSLDFAPADRADAARIYARNVRGGVAPEPEYKTLQDFLFRYIAAECGRLGMTVHIHTFAGAGRYFDAAGVNPLLLEPLLNDPSLNKTNFVLIHGGWPYTREMLPLLNKPNAYLDYSAQSLLIPPATLARTLREWLEWVPEKVMFATDAYPYSEEAGWEEWGWIAARRGREALVIALEQMMREDGISRERALELARMVLRGAAEKLYKLNATPTAPASPANRP